MTSDTQGTHTVSALLRYQANGIEKGPGQDVSYVGVDDDVRLQERVRLPFEEIEDYDADVYTRELICASESLVSPIGWERDEIRRYLNETVDLALSAFK